jgi:hypothetical protein
MMTEGLQLDSDLLFHPAGELNSSCIETFEARQTSLAVDLRRRELALTA